jgi:DNA-binding PadR family transcriptional regulator
MMYPEGMAKLLSSQRVLLKDFGAYAQRISHNIIAHAQKVAERAGRCVEYVASSKASKEQIARQIAKREGIQDGLICVLTCVEPCQSLGIVKDKNEKKLKLVRQQRKCLHLYFYYQDREFGLMHVRLQSWFPFTIQIGVNGREWLARQLEREGIGYEKHDNGFTRIDDLEKAQQLLQQLDQRAWAGWLKRRALDVQPLLRPNALLHHQPYYWTLSQSEYATDILFNDGESLQAVYPALVRHAMQHFHCQDVLRFLGRRIDGRFEGEIRTHWGSRIEGVRIKHWVEENSIKMYDKAGCVLRIETTINNTTRFKVRRRVTRRGQKVMAWVEMRKGVVDIRRRAELSMSANRRYLDALAIVGDSTPSHRVLDPVSQPVLVDGSRFRALRPISPDDSLVFAHILAAHHLLQGFRNVDLRRALFNSDEADPENRRKHSGYVTRTLRLLCSHGLIFRVPKTNYYRVTKKGHMVMNTAVQFRVTDVALLAA